MSKSSPSRLARKGKQPKMKPIKKRFQLTEQELIELRALNDMYSKERYKAEQFKANTALIPGGQQYANQVDAGARILENCRNGYVANLFALCGFPQGSNLEVDLKTGRISPKKKA